MRFHAVLAALAGAALSSLAAAAPQQNVIPGTDVALGFLDDLTNVGRQGAFPSGMNALAMSTTSCNKGSVDVPWLQPMDEDHPFIAFLVVRYDDSGRMIQISDRSHLKHGFFALANSQCDPCSIGPWGHDGTFLGVGCSDTYSVANNGDNFFLGPADEVDPWLGAWEADCSFFDAGLNPNPPFDCDGNKSFTQTQANSLGPIGNRVQIPDAAFDPTLNPEFAYSSYYVIRGEPEAARNNNLGHKAFQPTWTGSTWNYTDQSALAYGSVLDRWPGARVESNTNGNADGRVFLASSVTGPDAAGVYHYEFAIHNRDNARGIGELRLPLCASADVSGFGFKDVDLDPANGWSFDHVGGELVITTGNNPAQWNTVYNFWFDTTAAPESGLATVGQFLPGAGADSFTIAADVPTGQYDVVVGPGCGSSGAPSLAAVGQATLGHAGFALETAGNAATSTAVLFTSLTQAATPLGGGCNLYLGGAFGAEILQVGAAVTDGVGEATFALPVPADPLLEGVDLVFQGFTLTGAGPAFGLGDLSDGLLVRLGNDTAGCID